MNENAFFFLSYLSLDAMICVVNHYFCVQFATEFVKYNGRATFTVDYTTQNKNATACTTNNSADGT